MDEGKPAQRMSAYLLVAAERHSPGWECDHHYSIALEQHLCLIQECSFVFRHDVLYHIVHYDQIIFCNVGGQIHLKEITVLQKEPGYLLLHIQSQEQGFQDSSLYMT